MCIYICDQVNPYAEAYTVFWEAFPGVRETFQHKPAHRRSWLRGRADR